MKPKAYRKAHARIQASFDRWITVLGLRWWSMEIWYYASRKDFMKSSGASGPNVAMRNTTKWEYGDVTIQVCVPALAHLRGEDLDRAVVHELLHTLVNEMRDDGIKHEERVVTALTKAVFWIKDMER